MSVHATSCTWMSFSLSNACRSLTRRRKEEQCIRLFLKHRQFLFRPLGFLTKLLVCTRRQAYSNALFAPLSANACKCSFSWAFMGLDQKNWAWVGQSVPFLAQSWTAVAVLAVVSFHAAAFPSCLFIAINNYLSCPFVSREVLKIWVWLCCWKFWCSCISVVCCGSSGQGKWRNLLGDVS